MLLDPKKIFEDVLSRHLKKQVEVIFMHRVNPDEWRIRIRNSDQEFKIIKESPGGFSVL